MVMLTRGFPVGLSKAERQGFRKTSRYTISPTKFTSGPLVGLNRKSRLAMAAMERAAGKVRYGLPEETKRVMLGTSVQSFEKPTE